ncbi:hypothetical protein SKAU_G00308080 [Synaphobranchus kaupii]|uniref:Uncharacterized protein n=1 Tax=Synaphobranchus kaupii TaxID=118154 RepID=A0A9Q1IIV7_SYNKA|nr:hypothetical protein SKAU_G00308080 [Synaphobranchus kaupii]
MPVRPLSSSAELQRSNTVAEEQKKGQRSAWGVEVVRCWNEESVIGEWPNVKRQVLSHARFNATGAERCQRTIGQAETNVPLHSDSAR